jgi:hypothetical protein
MDSPAKYRKRPVVIEAVQWNGGNINEVWDAFGAERIYGPTEANPSWIVISTLEGDMRADVGDWIIRGVKGELYPCRNDVFTETYEAHERASDGR